MRGALAIGLCLAAAPAWAGDGENALSVGAGYATYATPNARGDKTLSPTAGATATVTFERGFGDYAAWRVHAAGAIYGGGGLVGTGVATVGLSYRLDVLQYVPYVALGLGGLVHGGGPFDTGIEPALEIGAGIDWLRDRSHSFGLEAAMTGFASDTTTLIVTARWTSRWGFF